MRDIAQRFERHGWEVKGRGRERSRIYYDILRSVIGQQRSDAAAKITRTQNDAYLPSDRFRKHLEEMSELALVEVGEGIIATGKGREFVIEYDRVITTLRRFGLA